MPKISVDVEGDKQGWEFDDLLFKVMQRFSSFTDQIANHWGSTKI